MVKMNGQHFHLARKLVVAEYADAARLTPPSTIIIIHNVKGFPIFFLVAWEFEQPSDHSLCPEDYLVGENNDNSHDMKPER